MKIEPYLFFNGRCEEAVEFYRQAVGAKVEALIRFKESPEPPNPDCPVPPGWEDKVMHGSFRIGETLVMASDGHGGAPAEFRGFGLSITVKDAAEAKKVFDALADGGQVQAPLSPTFFSPSFGMVVDRFGVMWMVIASPA
jgi:PhnB protein